MAREDDVLRGAGTEDDSAERHSGPMELLVPPGGGASATSTLADRMDEFVPGLARDPVAPRTLFQVLQGRVFLLVRHADGGTHRGEVPLDEFEEVVGKAREGWYDRSGAYLGEEI